MIDKYVLLNTGLRLPYASKRSRLADIAALYADLDHKMRAFLGTHNGRYLVGAFSNLYGTALVSEMKMLDFVLWQTRDRRAGGG